MTMKTRESFPDLNQVTGFTTDEEKFEPFGWYKNMRENSPVHYDEGQDVWSVFKYDDVKRVAEDKDCFSNAVLIPDILKGTLMGLDQPKHTITRSLISRAFTPNAMASWIPRIDSIVAELMASIRDRSKIDIVHDFAVPLPMIVISELLGVPSSDRAQFKEWCSALTLAPQENTPEEYMRVYEKQMQASAKLVSYFQEIIEVKRSQPANDIISDLIQAEEDGFKLSSEELLSNCVFLLIAGNETTTSLITSAIYSFHEYRLFRTLYNQPEFIPSGIEEVLRYRSPFQRSVRKVIQETEIGGKKLKPGDYIVYWIGSANRDEEHFERADELVLDRRNNKHLAFGKGIHVCLGSQLSRLEAKAALTALIQAYPDMTVDPLYRIDMASSNVYGLRSLPVQLGQLHDLREAN
ncbi:putative cytochrome P450 YjiB [Paenibacillus tyrfis]|uniref:cytochrome P450 n=1 Tax=Paenibacillus tyrfis TaxID=1501230 RepID=UPI002492527D|nr:cytochrome P450 [Paenibacillus tyrfis]GLI04437.1 putative cytochrome P450 YjiB [Paenibacillus tyrfis]